MKIVYRVVENQANLVSYQATQDEEKAIQLEILIDLTKPKLDPGQTHWDELILTPFRYDLPVLTQYQARFRPPFHMKNVFYSSEDLDTALYEYSFHFMRQRVHLQLGRKKKKNETGIRTGFSVDTDDTNSFDLKSDPHFEKIMNKNSYADSHEFIRQHPEIDYLIYPSARDPQKKNNIAIMEIKRISKKISYERALNYFYDYKKKEIIWLLRPDLSIGWFQVY